MSGVDWGPLLMLYPETEIQPGGLVPIPESVRERLGHQVIVARGLEPSLWLYPARRWDAYIEHLQSLPDLRYEARILVNRVAASATACDLTNEPVQVSPDLRRHAYLDTNVLLASAADHLQVWSP